jgi:DNA-binding beta-propeller fold protein YncE
MSIFEDLDTTPAAETAGGSGAGEVPTPEDGDGGRRPSRRTIIILLAIIGILLALLGGIFIWYLITHKPITALPGLAQDNPPHYSYSIFNVSQPLGVAVTTDGARVYVTQSDGARNVVAFSHTGTKLAVLNPPKSTGRQHLPLYVAVNPVTGDVYVTDRVTAAIYVYAANGKFLRTMAHRGYTGVWTPLAVAFDKSQNLYVTQAQPKTSIISVFDPHGVLVRTIKTPAPMSFPNGLAINSKGLVAVTDSNNGRAFIFTPDGKLGWNISSGSAPGDLGLPRGAAFDSQGHLVVVDTTDHNARVYSLKGGGNVSYVGLFGDQGIGNGLFQYPNGAAADGRALVYITDRVNNRVQVWSY